MWKESCKKNKIVTILLGENYTEIKAWQLKFAWSDSYFYEKLHCNESVTAYASLENLVRNVLQKTSFETEHLSQPFDSKSWYYKKIKLNLTLANPELFIIYWTCHHLFWFCFLKLLLIFYCQSSLREISILQKQFLVMPGVS